MCAQPKWKCTMYLPNNINSKFIQSSNVIFLRFSDLDFILMKFRMFIKVNTNANVSFIGLSTTLFDMRFILAPAIRAFYYFKLNPQLNSFIVYGFTEPWNAMNSQNAWKLLPHSIRSEKLCNPIGESEIHTSFWISEIDTWAIEIKLFSTVNCFRFALNDLLRPWNQFVCFCFLF